MFTKLNETKNLLSQGPNGLPGPKGEEVFEMLLFYIIKYCHLKNLP